MLYCFLFLLHYMMDAIIVVSALDVYYFADISSHLAIYGVTTGQQQLQH